MTNVSTQDADALCIAARDIARQIAGMADELTHLRHMTGGADATLVARQIIKLRDQATLLTAVIGDLEKTQGLTPAALG